MSRSSQQARDPVMQPMPDTARRLTVTLACG